MIDAKNVDDVIRIADFLPKYHVSLESLSNEFQKEYLYSVLIFTKPKQYSLTNFAVFL
jgi:hypothetical protein